MADIVQTAPDTYEMTLPITETVLVDATHVSVEQDDRCTRYNGRITSTKPGVLVFTTHREHHSPFS